MSVLGRLLHSLRILPGGACVPLADLRPCPGEAAVARRAGRRALGSGCPLPEPLVGKGRVLRFRVPSGSRALTGDIPRRAHILGQDNIALAGKVRFEGDDIVCEADPNQAVALCLQVDVGEVGVLLLQTCLLPRRERPYLLSLELARHRVMLFLVKLEDWLEGASPPEEPMTAFERAEATFMRALAVDTRAGEDALVAQDALAREALAQAIDATEKLSLWVGKVGMRLREHQIKGLSPAAARLRRPAVSVQAPFAPPEPKYCEAIRASADAVCLPLAWGAVNATEGALNLAHAEAWATWAARDARLPVVAGPIVDFRPGRAPQWTGVWRNDYESLREIAYEHLQRVCSRFSRVVSRWTPVSGVNLNDSFILTVEQMLDLVRLSIMAVRKFNPHARIHLEIDQPFGESATRNPLAVPPLLFAEMAVQQGLQVDALDLRIQMGDPSSGHGARDITQVSDLIDRYGSLGKPIAVTLGAPSTQQAAREQFACVMEPGAWRGGWSEQTQADWLDQTMTVVLGKPCVIAAGWHQLADAPPGAPGAEMVSGGVLNADALPKPAFDRLVRLRRANLGLVAAPDAHTRARPGP